MKQVQMRKYLQYLLCLLVLLKSCNGSPRKTETITLGGSIRRPGRSMGTVAAGTSSESNKSFNYQVNRYAIASKVAVHRYCKNTSSRVEAEILFKLGMETRRSPVENWWKSVRVSSSSVPISLPQAMSNPTCSQTPNSRRTHSAKAISEHQYFQSRIIVPIQSGEKRIFLTEYETFSHRPAWKAFLECKCLARTRDWGSDVCERGNVYFSKGVGGNKSFFVHARNSSGNFKVIAHLCFE